jgi:branched-chain amino acid transport system permease protein
MIIVGGLGSILGSIFGVLFIIGIPEGIRVVSQLLITIYPDVVMKFIDLKGVIFGIIIVAFLVLEPDGLAGRWEKVKTYFKNWPYTY